MRNILYLLPLILPAQASIFSWSWKTSHQNPRLSDRELRELALRELEERLLPITATTTVYIAQTTTQTIWVEPTDQVVFPIPSASVSEVVAFSTSDHASKSIASESDRSVSATSVVLPSESGDASESAVSVSASTVFPSASGSVSESVRPESASSVTATSMEASASASGSSTNSHTSSIPSLASSSETVLSSSAIDSSAFVSSSEIVSSSSAVDSVSASAPEISSWATSSRSSAPRYSRASGSGSARPTPAPTSVISASQTVTESLSSEQSSITSSSAAVTESSSASYSESVSSSYNVDETHGTGSHSASVTESIASSASASVSAYSSSEPSSTSSASGSSSTLKPLPKRLMAAYYPDWSGWYLTPEQVDWTRFDVIDFAFALPTADGGLQFTQTDSSDLLKRLVSTGHAAGKRVKLSIGGWTGSAYFSTITADYNLRETFVNNIVKAYHSYNLDGVDLDWEYPGTGGAAGNAVAVDDWKNYLTFLQDLRKALPQDALITTATQVWPFSNGYGSPITDVSGFAEVLDWILIMNYDIFSSDANPGPNAPLLNGCGNATYPLANAQSAVASWTTAGMPLEKITLGVPAYGYLSKSWANSLRQRSNFPVPPHKRVTNSSMVTLVARDDVTVRNYNGGDDSGQINFATLISQRALQSDGQGGFVGANGFVRHWDECSMTPWIKSEASGQIVTYDDTESMSLKGQFAAQAGIRGCNMFSIDGDWTGSSGSSWPLTDAVRSGLGL